MVLMELASHSGTYVFSSEEKTKTVMHLLQQSILVIPMGFVSRRKHRKCTILPSPPSPKYVLSSIHDQFSPLPPTHMDHNSVVLFHSQAFQEMIGGITLSDAMYPGSSFLLSLSVTLTHSDLLFLFSPPAGNKTLLCLSLNDTPSLRFHCSRSVSLNDDAGNCVPLLPLTPAIIAAMTTPAKELVDKWRDVSSTEQKRSTSAEEAMTSSHDMLSIRLLRHQNELVLLINVPLLISHAPGHSFASLRNTRFSRGRRLVDDCGENA